MEDKEPSATAKWLPLAGFVCSAGWLVVLWYWRMPHPPVGAYIAVLAFVVAVVSVWPPENKWAKGAWFLVFGAFLILEINTLYSQRDNDRLTDQQRGIDEDNRFVRLMADEHKNFAKALKDQDERFEEVLTQNQKQFNATLSRLGSLAGALSSKR
jgi:hypothetical protein